MNAVASSPKPGHRERLLEAANRCLREKGYARTTARDLVEVSETNLASIGYHFGGKEALLHEAIAAGFRTWTRDVESAMFGSERWTPAERFERSLAAMIDHFAELRPFLVAFVEAFPPAVRDPELRATMATAYEEARSAGAQMVERALSDAGKSIPEADARTLASASMALCDGLLLQWLLEPDAIPRSDEIATALTRLAGAVATT